MKKLISAVLAGAMAFSAVGVLGASAESYGDGDKIVVFGDSIAAGMGLDKKEFTYGEIIADYIGGTVDNYAVSGDTTTDMLKRMATLDDGMVASVKDADTVIISIGGNDIIQYAVADLLQYADKIGILVDGTDITKLSDAGLTDIINVIDREKAKAFAASDTNKYAFNKHLLDLGKKISFTTELDTRGLYKNAMLIQNQIVPNIQKAVEGILSVNPDAEIIIQTIYNPLELQKDYITSVLGSTYEVIFTSLIPIFDDILNSYSTQVAAAFSDNKNVKIADVKKSFDASENIDEYSGWYFTRMQSNNDIHPNQIGHLEIAATILDTMGVKASEDGGVFRTLYLSNPAKDSYPAGSKTGAEAYIGSYIAGDVDGNESVDSIDASAILKEYAAISTNKESTFNAKANKAGNVDGTEGITSTDASEVLKYYAYISTSGKTSFRLFQNSNKNVK